MHSILLKAWVNLFLLFCCLGSLPDFYLKLLLLLCIHRHPNHSLALSGRARASAAAMVAALAVGIDIFSFPFSWVCKWWQSDDRWFHCCIQNVYLLHRRRKMTCNWGWRGWRRCRMGVVVSSWFAITATTTTIALSSRPTFTCFYICSTTQSLHCTLIPYPWFSCILRWFNSASAWIWGVWCITEDKSSVAVVAEQQMSRWGIAAAWRCRTFTER